MLIALGIITGAALGVTVGILLGEALIALERRW